MSLALLLLLALAATALGVLTAKKAQRQLCNMRIEKERLALRFEKLSACHSLVTTNIAASVIIRHVSGEILFCSAYTEVLSGYPTEEVGLRSDFLESICLEEDRPRYIRARQVCELGEDSLVRYQVRHRSGIKLWLETRMVPVMDSQGEVESILTVTIDVTAAVTHQRQIEEKNRDLSDFAYMVSHDLKAPIFTIKGMVSALKEDYGEKLGADGTGLLQYIEDAAKRLETLVSSVIEYSALSKKQGRETEVSLNAVLADVMRDQAQLIQDAQAKIRIEADMPSVRGEPIRIYQIFANLLNNALKYRAVDRPLEILIRCLPRGDASRSELLTFEVKDNGLGIPESKLDDIFRPYQRAHTNSAHAQEVEGNGIGLACVKKIVERLGGSVSVKSNEGIGSSFSVILPAAEAKPQEIPPELERCFRV